MYENNNITLSINLSYMSEEGTPKNSNFSKQL